MAGFEKGDVYWIDFPPPIGSEVEGRRPAIVLQSDWIRGLNTVLVVPLSSNIERRKQPTGVFVPSAESGLDFDSVAVCHLLSAVSKDRVLDSTQVGRVPEKIIHSIHAVLIELLDLSIEGYLAGPPSA